MKKSRLLLMLLGLFFSFVSLSAQITVGDGSVATGLADGNGSQLTLGEETPTSTGYCGKDEDGLNVMWQRFDLEGNLYKLVLSGHGEMADFTNTTLIRPWGRNEYLKELVFEDGVESTGDNAFYYANALESVSWGTLKHIGKAAFYRPYKLGANTTIVFPSTLESIAQSAFGYGDEKGAINGVFDFSACTNLTEVGEVAFSGTSVTCILPPSVKASYKNSFKLPPYMVLPDGMTLFVNNTQMPDDGNRATVNLSLSQPFTFQLKPNYYRLNLGEVNVEGCTLQFYTTMNTRGCEGLYQVYPCLQRLSGEGRHSCG